MKNSSNTWIDTNKLVLSKTPTPRMTLNKLAEMFVEFREEVKTNINGIKTDIKNIHGVLKRNNLK